MYTYTIINTLISTNIDNNFRSDLLRSLIANNATTSDLSNIPETPASSRLKDLLIQRASVGYLFEPGRSLGVSRNGSGDAEQNLMEQDDEFYDWKRVTKSTAADSERTLCYLLGLQANRLCISLSMQPVELSCQEALKSIVLRGGLQVMHINIYY